MAFFTSNRERRMWLWTALIMVAIFSTLGLTGKLAEALRERHLVTPAFFFGMFLVGITVLVQGLKIRPRGIELAAWLGIAAVYFMVFTRMAIPEERTHLIEYGVVGVLIYEALLERAKQGQPVRFSVVLAIFATTLLGTIDECIQWFLPNRVFDPEDILFNFLAALMAVTASFVLSWMKKWRN